MGMGLRGGGEETHGWVPVYPHSLRRACSYSQVNLRAEVLSVVVGREDGERDCGPAMPGEECALSGLNVSLEFEIE